jgi:hypothetical protein
MLVATMSAPDATAIPVLLGTVSVHDAKAISMLLATVSVPDATIPVPMMVADAGDPSNGLVPRSGRL